VEPFRIKISQDEINNLSLRLRDTRWPAPAPAPEGGSASDGDDWSRGTPLGRLQEIVDHWQNKFSWREVEQRLNRFPQYRTHIDGLGIHFVHVRSPHPGATPLLLTHGWPGSFAEFDGVIDALVDPVRHGGSAEDACDVVIPSLPGFGFSDKPTGPGWDIPRTARAWSTLMHDLGYDRYVAQGGDVGAWISLALAGMDPAATAVHVNFLVTPPPAEPSDMPALTPEEFARLGMLQRFVTDGAGYMSIQSTRPQSLAYALTDSPAGLLGWMYEKFHTWSDPTGDAPTLTFDQILTHVSLYWFTRSAGSAAQFYYENAAFMPTAPVPPPTPPVLDKPLGVASFLNDQAPSIRKLAEPAFSQIVQWREHEHGGHFAAMEVPDVFVQDVRDFAARLVTA